MNELNRDHDELLIERFIDRLRSRAKDSAASAEPTTSVASNLARLGFGFTDAIRAMTQPASLEQQARILDALVELATIGLEVAKGVGALK